MSEQNPTPLEELFDLDPGSTPTLMANVVSKPIGELIDPSTGEVIEQKVDATDAEIAKEERAEDLKLAHQLDVVHASAMAAFENQHALSQQVDPKFSARNSEVAAQYLNIALDSIKTRGKIKYDRQKIAIAKGNGGVTSTQNNLIIADRNDVLKSLFHQDFEKPIKNTILDEIKPDKL